MMTPSEWKFRSVSSCSSSHLHGSQNSHRPKRFSFKIGVLSHGKTNEEPPSGPSLNALDPLPDDQVKLEGIVNYHLSQVGRLKLEVDHYNSTIELLSCTTPPEGMECVARKLHERIRGVMDARKQLGEFMSFHVREIYRILKLKQEMTGNTTDDYPTQYVVTSLLHFCFQRWCVFFIRFWLSAQDGFDFNSST